MNLNDLINTPENLEPETIRHFLPDFSEEDLNWVFACRLVKHTTWWVEDMFIFENVVRALNKLPVDFTELQLVSPKHIWYAMDLIKRLWKKVKINYSWEVRQYIKYIFTNDGIYGITPWNEDDEFEVEVKAFAERLLDPTTPETVDPYSKIHMAAQRLAELIIYTRGKKKNEHN
jgi:hypothetical protein